MNRYYFIGIGGIGMSALARFFNSKGNLVAGYDIRDSELIFQLKKENIDINFTDDISYIPEEFRKKETIVIYTPAIPIDHKQLNFFKNNGNRVLKRSEALGEVTLSQKALCVAGTHGKTTTSTILAHLLKSSSVDCNAFLGGLSNNYNNNLLLSNKSALVVIEADEFDRSFHHLKPYMSIITSDDPDHLDIYGDEYSYRESFEHYTSLIVNNGVLVIKKGLSIKPKLHPSVKCYTYSIDDNGCDFFADNISIDSGHLFFDWHYTSIDDLKSGFIRVELGVPLMINVENATAAMALAYLNGVSLDELSKGISSFKGVYRRFDRVLDNGKFVLIDDYAHHPKEIEASVNSVRCLYKDKSILGIFQPHLYSRTKDFHKDFAISLSKLDEIILLDIYPAREKPIKGVTSEIIREEINKIDSTKSVVVLDKDNLLSYISNRNSVPSVLLMVGAGDIDRLVNPMKQCLENK